MKISSNCIICKGRDPAKYCGRTACPIILKSQAVAKVKDFKMSEDFSSQSPSVFVGHYGYPKVNVGLLSPPERKDDTWIYDAPRAWAKLGYKVPQVVDYRSSLINSRAKSDVKSASSASSSGKIIEIAQEISQASRPVDVEVHLNKKPKVQTNFDPYVAPTGPNANAKSATITSNSHIKTQVQKRVDDTDLLSNKAVTELYGRGYDENFLSKLLSMGNLGIGKNRKLVPTRWSITAIDDNVGKDMLNQVKEYEPMEYSLFFGGYMGNYYIILVFEDAWQYELFETYMPNASWNQDNEVSYTTDYESFEGRKSYAYNTAGGYYAARLPIIEYFKKNKKQGCVRFITGEYTCPLGVWVVREATRKSIEGKRHCFETKEQMIEYAKFIAKKKFNFDLDVLLKESVIYDNVRKQMKLSAFVK